MRLPSAGNGNDPRAAIGARSRRSVKLIDDAQTAAGQHALCRTWSAREQTDLEGEQVGDVQRVLDEPAVERLRGDGLVADSHQEGMLGGGDPQVAGTVRD
jgi:hypothetical protein